MAYTVQAEHVLDGDTRQVEGRDGIGEYREQALVALGCHQRGRLQRVPIQAGMPLVVALADDQNEFQRVGGTHRLSRGRCLDGKVDGDLRLLALELQRQYRRMQRREYVIAVVARLGHLQFIQAVIRHHQFVAQPQSLQ